MKLVQWLLGLALLLSSCSTYAIDVAIRVLGVYPSQMSGQIAYMMDQLTAVRETWDNTQLAPSSGISVQILNSGQPVAASLPTLPPTLFGPPNTSSWAAAQPEIVQLRNAWEADVIVLLTSATDLCGVASQYFFNGNFFPDSQGIDLTARHTSYVAVVATGCPLHVAAHEFGHLLGGGHHSEPGLYGDSRAHIQHVLEPWPINLEYDVATALINPGPNGSDTCPGPYSLWCLPQTYYSSNTPMHGDGGHQNARALNQTAKSVANYISPPTPPTPILNPPINVHGFLIGHCDPSPWTRHQVHWSDDPQTNVEVTRYEIWYSQPPGEPFEYAGSVPSYQTFGDVWVVGASSRIHVNACTNTACSGFSVSSYLAEYTCNF